MNSPSLKHYFKINHTMKVAIITNIIPPYRLSLFETIGKKTDLTVYLSIPMEPNRNWVPWSQSPSHSFKSIQLNGFTIRTKRGLSYVQPIILFHLLRLSPDTVVASGFNFNSLISVLYGKLLRKRTLLWSEATTHSERNSSIFRTLFRKGLVKLFDGAISVGTSSADFLYKIGFKRDQIFLSRDSMPASYPSTDEHALILSKINKKTDSIYFLYAGQLIPRKGVDLLLHAWAKVKTPNICLIIMGSGPEENQLRELAIELGINNLIFVGWCDDKSKWAYYFSCDVFLFPTLHDVWGLVLNEAMMAGKPIITSPYAGAAVDLVHDNLNGYIIDPQNHTEWAIKIIELATNHVKREKMGKESLQIINDFTIKKSADGFTAALFK